MRNHIANLNLLLWHGIIFIFLVVCTNSDGIVIDHDNNDDLRLDQRPFPSEAEIFEEMARDLPSLPIDFWQRNRHKTLQVNETCAPFPHILDLKYHNTYWQTHRHDNLTFYMYSAFYDSRPRVVATPVLRMLAMVNQIRYDYPRQFCQMWFEESSEPVIVPVQEYRDIWVYEWGNALENHFYPLLITCELPEAQRELIPQTVSLVSNECDKATNNLKVTYEHPGPNETKGSFAVCSKALFFGYTDMSARLVEWLEVLRVLGAEKVIIYYLQVHTNITRVFDYYGRQGFVDSPRITLARGEPEFAHFIHFSIKHDELNRRLNEVLQLNDCIYRNMYKYDYIAVIDIDEVIMPLGDLTSWHDLIRVAEQAAFSPNKDCYACLCFRNVYYPRYPEYVRYTNEIPQYMYMLQHVRRVREHLVEGLATKCLHNANYVITMHNHYPRSFVESCESNAMNITIAQMQHYREPDIASHLENPVIDDNMWRFKELIVERSLQVFRALKFSESVKVNSTDWEQAEKDEL